MAGIEGCRNSPPNVACGRLGWSDDQPLPIGADIQRRFGIDPEQVQDGPVDRQCQAVSLLGKLFDHTRFRISDVSPLASAVAAR
jgi:hypothetical protein